MSEYILGIDTGGTYTDGVLIHNATREILKTTKTLTTKPDLSVGILAVLNDLLPADPTQIRAVVISTTLATNAIAEGKGQPVGLLLLGYDPELIQQFSLGSRFGAASFHYFQGGHDLYANQQAPLDSEGIRKTAREIQKEVDAIAISGYFSPFNASHEELAYRIVAETVDLPVVLGHELSTRLDSVQRATTASLNASLLSHLKDFIQAMQASLRERGITAPLMVVRGDGALVGADIAQSRPIETVHSGPAASASGGCFLAGVDKALVIDIGGTTTDIALIEDGQVQIREEGTTVGEYRTSVRAARIHSLGLGGDSRIKINVENQLKIGPARVQPLSSLAHQHREVFHYLKKLAAEKHKKPNLKEIEFWYLIRQPPRIPSNPRARQVIELLQSGPLSLPVLLEKLNIFHPLQSGATSLIREEIIGVAGLTPTDLFHVRGDFTPWNQEAAQIAAWLTATHLGISVDEFINKTIEQMVSRIARETITYLTGQTLEPAPYYAHPDDLGLWLFEENASREDPNLGCEISLKMPLVGIGAPASLLLPQVAGLLHAEYIEPPHYQVANAVGAAVGSLIAYQEAWVIPQSVDIRTVGYYVQSGKDRERFRDLQEALEYAESATRSAALEQVNLMGIQDPVYKIDQLQDGAESYRVRATVTGKPDPGKSL
ncbi:MAG: hydantoinase/oxoprolinase family protein [Anaerolineales bacterium]|nr:hydantoinase/oxoprolinase family protein [Anaerolineales bacterium]